MSLYIISTEVRKTYRMLSDFAYNSFDILEPEMRLKVNTMLETLNVLANKIEAKADEEFDN